MPAKNGFFVPTTDIKSRIKAEQAVKDVDFTILSHSVDFKDPTGIRNADLDLLGRCLKAYPKEFVRRLVCIRPERLINNEIMAQLQATVMLDSSPDDEYLPFRIAIRKVMTAMEKEGSTTALIKQCTDIGNKLKVDLPLFYQSVLGKTPLADSPFTTKEESEMRAFYDEIADKYDNPDELEAVCTQRWLAHVYTKRSQDAIGNVVSESIEQLCEKGGLQPLDYVDQEGAVAIFTTGGVASGKGTCLTNIQDTLLQRMPKAVEWSELVHHNADRMKAFLLDPLHTFKDHRLRFSQYTYEEALFIKDRVAQIISIKGSADQQYPHFIHDQTKLKPDELREAAQRYGEIIIAAVSTKAETAIQRSFYRGEKTQRYEHTEGLLGSHQAVPGEFIKSISQNALIGQGVSVAMYDNNSSQLSMFASIDMDSKSIVIYDEKCMEEWIKKETINPLATDESSIYRGEPRSTYDYFAPLLDLGFELDNQTPHISSGSGYAM